MTEILYKELSFAIVGAAMEVHKGLGPGFENHQPLISRIALIFLEVA